MPRLSRSRHARALLAAAAGATVVAAVIAPAAASDTWDNSSGDAKWFTPTNWSSDGVPGSSDDVTFPVGYPGGGGATIDLTGGSAAAAQSLTFADSYTLTNGSLTLSGGGIAVAAGKTVQMNEPVSVSGTAGLTKTGGGTLVLTNTLTPAPAPLVTVTAGTLRLASQYTIGGATVLDSAILDLGSVTLDKNVTLNGGSTLIGGRMTTGVVTVAPTATSVTLAADDGTFTLGDSANDLTGGSSGLSVSVQGPNATVLAQPSNLVAHWVVNGGTLQPNSDAALGAAGNDVTLNGGTLLVSNTFTSARPIFLSSSGGTLRFPTYTPMVTLNSAVNGAAGAAGAGLTVVGGGTAWLNAASTRTGETVLDGSEIVLGSAAALGTGKIRLLDTVFPFYSPYLSLTLGLSVANDISIETTRSPLIGAHGDATLKGKLLLAADATNLGISVARASSASATLTIGNAAGAIVGGSSQTMVTINRSASASSVGDVSIPFANAGFSGSWEIGGGRVRIGDAQSLGVGTSPVVVDGTTGVLELDNGITLHRNVDLMQQAGLVGSGRTTVTGKVNVRGTNAYLGTTSATDVLTIGDEPNDLTGGGFNLATPYFMGMSGDGTVVLSQPSNFVGWWATSSHGTLRVDATGALGATGNGMYISNTVLINAPQRLATVDIWNGTARLAAGGGTLLNLDQLLDVVSGTAQNPVYPTGKLDVADNALIVHSTPVGTWNGSTYTDLTRLIRNGCNGGAWNGADGIGTTDARAVSGVCALGIATASQALGIAATATGTWHAQTVAGSDVLVAFTYAGDANLDGVINIDDYTQIDSSVSAGGALKGWFNGDFNYDGNVDIDDYTIIDSNIAVQGAPLTGAAPLGGFAGAGVAAVPEPGGIAIVLAGWGCLSARRRNRVFKPRS